MNEMSDSTDSSGAEEAAADGTGVGETPTAETLVCAVADVLRQARPMPLSSNVAVPRDETLAALDEALVLMPEELRAARWLLKERDEFLASAKAEADEIVAAGRAQAEQMVRRTELVRQSEIYGRRVRDEAEAESRHWRRQTEDYCEQRLAQFELTLGKIALSVQNGRERLSALPAFEADDELQQSVNEEPTGDRGGGDELPTVIDLTDERVASAQLLFDQDFD